MFACAGASERDGDVALHGHRGLDAPAARARGALRRVLGEHRRVLREAFARHGGVEVDTQGDAFFFAFARASDAIAAAGEAQRRSRGGPVRVRIGVHTGEPVVTEEGYVGRRRAPGGADHGRRPRRPGAPLRGDAAAPRLDSGAARPRRAPPQGPDGAAAPLPARRRGLPAAADTLPHEPADPADATHRPGTRARGGRGAASLASTADADRARRERQDAPGASARRRSGRAVPRRCLLGSAPGAPRPRARRARDRGFGRRRRRPDRPRGGQAAAHPPGQLRAGHRGGADDLVAARRNA